MEPKIQAVDGIEVISKIKENIQIMLRKKVTAVKVSRLDVAIIPPTKLERYACDIAVSLLVCQSISS